MDKELEEKLNSVVHDVVQKVEDQFTEFNHIFKMQKVGFEFVYKMNGLLERIEKLEQLILLTDSAVSNQVIPELSILQWKEYKRWQEMKGFEKDASTEID